SVLEHEFLRARRDRTELSLLMIDIDQFKAYNDHFGHRAGDECLRTVGAAIRTRVNRPSDLVARDGGEELAVILPSKPGGSPASVAEAIRQAVEDLRQSHPSSQAGDVLTLSIGLATVGPDEHSPATLVEAADKALYAAK